MGTRRWGGRSEAVCHDTGVASDLRRVFFDRLKHLFGFVSSPVRDGHDLLCERGAQSEPEGRLRDMLRVELTPLVGGSGTGLPHLAGAEHGVDSAGEFSGCRHACDLPAEPLLLQFVVLGSQLPDAACTWLRAPRTKAPRSQRFTPAGMDP